MSDTYFTIGMAGHIDHGKTTLTKALSRVDTDRLKEEKERSISIELGYAPLQIEEGVNISIIDVPGHERFIRQMIAGVAGIDLVVLVIAADEGVMPQTKEHLEILEFLGIEHCIVAISKVDRVDEEMLEFVTEDIKDGLAGTIFHDAPFVYVDGISRRGIDNLNQTIISELKLVGSRDAYGSFRLPVDQVFTVKGQGTIVRGTTYEGIVQQGSQLRLLPKDHKVRARQIQVHHEEQHIARAGQRTAINLGGVDKDDVRRGDVLVASDHFLVTKTIDVSLRFVEELRTSVKQRMPVKIHVGTSEVMGRIVFFDRNELKQADGEILCQIQLDEEIVVRRGDRFILRRPTPVETIGGGWVIQPEGGKYRFGKATIDMLQNKKQSTPEDLIEDVLSQHTLLDVKQLIQYTSLDEHVVNRAVAEGLEAGYLIEVNRQTYGLTKTFNKIKDEIISRLENYHQEYPMRLGISKAEIVQMLSGLYSKMMIEYSLNQLVQKGNLDKEEQFVSLAGFHPYLPRQWKQRMLEVINTLDKDGVTVKKWEEYITGTLLSKHDADELALYLVQTKQAFRIMNDRLIHRSAVDAALAKLKQQTDETFDIKEAKDILDVSRKYLIPFLEMLDQLKITTRIEDERKWMSNSENLEGGEHNEL
ncbi:selenocysteine-specific translation elongation factor [Halobacillus naozhouensis]|uniref:Selenocysteine-specific elongation factor n=1 Tax=Halobacillus naozhouensis TaxID=554880 RepID=A0ABY8J009_9BACI|nr:selenocysteine-specific translation elongation factor [Halobacillus naozhouensis]WFT74784.1 selenocysteine-specific translation elongation factor [Halobacillus naozhouensis]